MKVHLPSKDMHLYGRTPVSEDFSVVECQYCGMVLKTQALYNHIKKRHHIGSISEDPQLPMEPPLKKIKIEKDCDDFGHKPLQSTQPLDHGIDLFKKPFTPPPKKQEVKQEVRSHQPQPIVSGKIMHHLHRSLSMDPIDGSKSRAKLLVKLKRFGEDSWVVVSTGRP